MSRTRTTVVLILTALILGLLLQIEPRGYTRVTLALEGRKTALLTAVLQEREPLTLTWRHSQFGYQVTEVFHARNGQLVQDRVTFAEPGGPPPPRVSAAEVADLYHTGATFDARGLDRPFTRIVYRIGEIGNPQLRLQGKTVALRQEAGFGGRAILTSSRPRLFQLLF
jgi:hypothetical protein